MPTWHNCLADTSLLNDDDFNTATGINAMCGRFANTETSDSLKASFKVSLPGVTRGGEVQPGSNRMPRYNISPGVNIETVIGKGGDRLLIPMHWGFSSSKGQKPLINARGETIFEKPSFSGAAQRTRCLVVATGWYEWKAPRQPYYIFRSDQMPMAMAGLYRQTENGLAAVVVTRSATDDLGEIHHRAPLLLGEAEMAAWLNPGSTPAELKSLILPTGGAGLAWHPVHAEVGNVRKDHDGLIRPDETHGAEPAAQLDLF